VLASRERELKHHKDARGVSGARLVVVYGRRRVDKTALLREFVADKPHVYWTATLTSDEHLLRSFSEALWSGLHPGESGPGFAYDTREAAFTALAATSDPGWRVVVIDEYPYLASTAFRISSVLQSVWDSRLESTAIMLVLCGSSIGMMHRETLDYGAPL